MADPYVAQVRGTYGMLPRGWPWVMLVWSAVAGLLLATQQSNRWFATGSGIVIFAGGVAFVAILRNVKTPAFMALSEGIRLGGQRHRLQVPWEEIREIRVSAAAHGAQVDVVLMPPLPVARR